MLFNETFRDSARPPTRRELRRAPPRGGRSDQAAGGHADGLGPGHDDVIQEPHVDLVEEIPAPAGQIHVARAWLGRAAGATPAEGRQSSIPRVGPHRSGPRCRPFRPCRVGGPGRRFSSTRHASKGSRGKVRRARQGFLPLSTTGSKGGRASPLRGPGCRAAHRAPAGRVSAHAGFHPSREDRQALSKTLTVTVRPHAPRTSSAS